MMTSNQWVGRSIDDLPTASPPTQFFDAGDCWASLPARPLLIRRRFRSSGTDDHGAIGLQPVHWLDGGGLHGAEVVAMSNARLPAIDPPHDVHWLLQAACVQARVCGDGLVMSLTLPGGTRLDAALVEQLARTLKRSGLDPAMLQIGLGEPDLRALGADALLALSAVRDTGVGVALDVSTIDASLRTLGRLPVTCLRLPACTAAGLPHSRHAREAAANAIGVAHALDATVLALGVRTALERDLLADMACDHATGAVFGPIMPARRFRSALRDPMPA